MNQNGLLQPKNLQINDLSFLMLWTTVLALRPSSGTSWVGVPIAIELTQTPPAARASQRTSLGKSIPNPLPSTGEIKKVDTTS
jgi:hypothetical protein